MIESLLSEALFSEEKEAHQAILNKMTDGWWDTSLVDGTAYYSPSFKKLFGYEDHELPNLTTTWQKLIFPEDLDKAMDLFEQHINDGVPYVLPVRYRHKDGSTKWVICRGQAIKDEDGVYRRAVGTHTDITKLKETEASLRRTNKELENFAYVASHDLQAPLRHIALYVEKLENSLTNINEEQIQYMNYIQTSVKKMRELVSMLLSYARVSNILQDLSCFDAQELIQQVSQMTLSNHPEKEIKFHFSLSKNHLITANLINIDQVFSNLISNAVKFSKPDNLCEITISMKDDKDNWIFCVKDNGIGIEGEYLKKIFELFQRLEDNKTYPGTGIGLSICKKIIETHGGRIWVRSIKNKGSEFYFTLPKYLQTKIINEDING